MKLSEKTARNIAVCLEYDGSRYRGWQKQGNTEMTIQGKLEAVLSRMAGEPVEVHGSGRTDEGVHARGQVAISGCRAGSRRRQRKSAAI